MARCRWLFGKVALRADPDMGPSLVFVRLPGRACFVAAALTWLVCMCVCVCVCACVCVRAFVQVVEYFNSIFVATLMTDTTVASGILLVTCMLRV